MKTSPHYEQGQSSHQLYVIRTSSHTANKVTPFIDSYRLAALEAIRGLQAGKVSTLTKAISNIDELSGWFQPYKEITRDDLYLFAGLELSFQTELFSIAFTKDYIPKVPTDDRLLKAIRETPLNLNDKQATWTKMLNSFDIDTRKQITDKVNQAYFGGDINGLRKAIDGTMIVRERQIKAVTRTLYQHTASVAKQSLYRANSDIVIGYQIVTTFDSRRSRICTARDGEIYLYADSFNPMLPFHYNERSTDIPVLSDEFAIDESGALRAAKGADGGQQVRVSTTGLEFAKGQPAFWQDDLLGADRGKIFRNAGLTPDEFQDAMRDQFDRPVTLKQMGENDARIFEYMRKTKGLEKYTDG